MHDLLNGYIAEGKDLGALDEPRWPVHVPHPGIRHRHLVVDVAPLGANLEIDDVTQIEPSLGFYGIFEDPDDVLVLAVELQLHPILVLFQIFGTHDE